MQRRPKAADLTFNVNVTWVGAHHPAFTVNYATVTGTAGAADFTSTAGVLSVGKDATLASITVPTTQDNIFEPDENFTVVLDPLSTTANVLVGVAARARSRTTTRCRASPSATLA